MNLNATLFGQMITFAVFVWFTMRFVWPPVTRAMQDRQEKIAEGLAAAEEGVRELESARIKISEQMGEAKVQAAAVMEQANKRASQAIDDAKETARAEGERLVALAREEIEQAVNVAKNELRQQVGALVVQSAGKILEKEIDQNTHSTLINQAIEEL